jgi:RimJ/RimL family protein N-acetyltransferase
VSAVGSRPDPHVEPEPFLLKPVLQGELVLLRAFTEADISAMGAVLADSDVLRLTGSAHSTAEVERGGAATEQSIRDWYHQLAARGDRLDLAIVDRGTGRCVGEVVLNDLDAGNDSCNFRILIGPEGRDRGLGGEATRLVLDHAFRTTGLHRIGLEVYEFNPRARRVYEKAGFRAEGVLRDALRFDDVRINAVVMSLLRDEWAAGR